MAVHKYKATRELKSLIDRGKVPEDINIRHVIEVYYRAKKITATNRERRLKYPLKEKHWSVRRSKGLNYRSTRMGGRGEVTPEEVIAVWDKYNGACNHCQATENICFDHIIPYFHGGRNEASNLQLLCRRCNMMKGVSIPES